MSFAQSAGNNITGIWVNKDKTLKVEIIKTNSGYEGIIREAEDKSMVEKKITGLQDAGNGTFKDGTIHIIKMGSKAKCSGRLLNAKTLELKISKGILFRTQKLTKL